MDYQKLMEFRNGKNPFGQKLGITVEEIGAGCARVKKTVGPDDLNPVGVPHGGCYFSVADTACGAAMASHGFQAVTLSSSYEFLRSASIGDTIIGEAREIKSGGTISVYGVRLTDQSGVLLGTGTFTFYNLKKPLEF